jgi:hypothetical protein
MLSPPLQPLRPAAPPTAGSSRMERHGTDCSRDCRGRCSGPVLPERQLAERQFFGVAEGQGVVSSAVAAVRRRSIKDRFRNLVKMKQLW